MRKIQRGRELCCAVKHLANNNRQLLTNCDEHRTSRHLSKLLTQDSNTSVDTAILDTTSPQIGVGTDNSNDKRLDNGVVCQQVELMGFTELRMTCCHKAEQMIFELFTELLNHALTEFRTHAFKVSLLSPDWNFIPSPAMQFSIVAASTCFVRKSASIFLVDFLPSVTLHSVTIACTQRNTASMCCTRPSPRRLPISILAVASIHT